MKYIIISGIVILAVFITILVMIPKGIEPLTEVYFENHTSLTKYTFLNATHNFTFTVHNLEYTPMEYEYVIEAIDQNDSVLFEIERKMLVLLDNQSITLNRNFTFDKPFGRAKINIELNKITSGNDINAQRQFWWKDENYPNTINIHFWVEEITGPTITFE